jgi:serine acetyltransferase
MKQTFSQTIQLIRSDMQFRCDYEHKKLTVTQVLSFLLNHTVLSQVLYRLQSFFATNHLGFLASFIEGLNSLIFTVRIDSSTKIGARFLILHANYINIGKNVTIGENCILAHQNSIGPAFTLDSKEQQSDQGPIIGDYVLLGVGSVVYGNITIGHHSKVAINSAVDCSFPEHSTLVGVPAKNRALLKSTPLTSSPEIS